jgi:predicted translin family RNA/ssDNA-binding protein
MNEEERRQEILKAEEAIRRLASEMAHASESAAQAEEARQGLEEASTAVNEAKEAVHKAARVVAAYSAKSHAALTTATDILQEAVQAVEGSTQRISKALDSLTSLVRWVLIFAAIAALGVCFSIVLLLFFKPN